VRWALLVLTVIVSLSCGSTPATTPSPATVSLAGTWSGTATLTAATGGECFNTEWAEFVGFPFGLFPFEIAQTANNVRTSNLPVLGTSNVCDYSGTITGDSFALRASNCTGRMNQVCRDGRNVRDLVFVSATLTGQVTGSVATANGAETWNVIVTGTSTTVGMLTLTSRYAISR